MLNTKCECTFKWEKNKKLHQPPNILPCFVPRMDSHFTYLQILCFQQNIKLHTWNAILFIHLIIFFARPVVYECHIYLITTKFKFEGLKIMCTNSRYIQDVSTWNQGYPNKKEGLGLGVEVHHLNNVKSFLWI